VGSAPVALVAVEVSPALWATVIFIASLFVVSDGGYRFGDSSKLGLPLLALFRSCSSPCSGRFEPRAQRARRGRARPACR
jgi:hypothetical protein